MAIHDWTRVDAGIFHHFHQAWIDETSRALNRGLLPPDHYALAEQIAGGLGPDVLTLQLQGPPVDTDVSSSPRNSLVLTATPPRVWFRAKTEMDAYAAKANVVAIRHVSNHRVVAVVEIVPQGNKNNRHALRAFVDKAEQLLCAGVHLLIVDLFPPSPRDPQGIHKAVWDRFIDNDFAPPADRRLTLAAYIGGPIPESFVEPAAVGLPLADMPLFLTPEEYVLVPLEATYQSAWQAMPAYWRGVLEKQK